MALGPGTRLGFYEIVALIGDGGMGVVYRAFDTKLNRPAAIKFLRDEWADPAARRRFQREAQTVSSLNHPHILTVYDIGEFEGQQYLITEFVDGGTLEEWARTRHRTWREVVDVLVGVGDGLAVAHAAGILHRDVKPANILVAQNGYAKLADFGLAKLTEGTDADLTRTVTEGPTRAGVIIGTLPYMSPEQVSGKPVDERSDIFAFGVVLYELLTGRRPFEGATGLETMQRILAQKPEPLADSVPSGLRIVVEKALEKEASDRYQSMRELVVDLRRVLRQTVEEISTARTGPRRPLAWIAGALVVAAVAVGVALWRTESVPQRPVQYEQLTHFTESVTSPALSPDGRMLTFIRGENAFTSAGDIYVQALPDGEPVQLTHDASTKMGPAFLPDGARIAYTTTAGHHHWDTWVVPVLGGGDATRMMANASGMTWIGTGAGPRRILFSEYKEESGIHMGVVTSTESRSEARNVYVPVSLNGMAHRSSLSPDGKWVLVTEMEFSDWQPCRLAPFDGSALGRLVGPSPSRCTNAAWSRDGQWMYFSADLGSGFHTWRQRFPDGTPEQVTFGATEEEGLAFFPDGRSFVTSIGLSQSTVWIHDSRGERQISSQGYGYRPALSRDGTKLFYLVRSDKSQHYVSGTLWVADLDSGKREALLPDFLVEHFDVSADGSRVVFIRDDGAGGSPVWLARLDGRSAPRRLTSIQSARTAYFGTDGEVLVVGEEKGTPFLFRVKEDSATEKVIPTSVRYLYAVSPDGKWTAVWIEGTTEATKNSVVVYPTHGGGPPIMVCGACAGAGAPYAPPQVSWSSDQSYLYVHSPSGTYAISIPHGQGLPAQRLTSADSSLTDLAALPGARLVGPRAVFTGPTPDLYAFTRGTVQRNIYRVLVP